MGKVKVTVEGYQCERCGHIWVPRKRTEYPTICPKCKSPYWDRPSKAKPKGKEGH